MNIGLDYRGKELNEYAEEIRIFNLNDGRQVIEYLHSAPKFDKGFNLEGLVMKKFANEFRAEGNSITVEDILRNCSSSE